MSNINFSVDFTGAPDPYDVEAGTLAVELYNRRNPNSPLPYGTGAELKASYLTVLATEVSMCHSRFQRRAADAEEESSQAMKRWRMSTPAQRAAALAELAELS